MLPALSGTRSIQSRSTAAAGQQSVFSQLQIFDSQGNWYLDQDIDFGAVGVNEVFQNVKFILLTEYFSVPLDREFGMDFSMVDRPIPVAEAMLSQEIAMKIALYEPRCQFTDVTFDGDAISGKLAPSVTIEIISTEEATSLVPFDYTPSEIQLGQAVVFAGRIPSFMAFISSLTQGPVGPKGDKGDKGDKGEGINIKGTVATFADLPAEGNTPGDVWITADTGHGWSWSGTAWVDMGPIQGPIGETGPPGNTGATGSPSWTLNTSSFTVPPVNGSAVVNVQDPTWMTTGEIIWIQDAAGAGNAAPFRITSITGNSVTILNVPVGTGGGGTALQMVFGEVPSGAVNGINKAYATANPYTPNQLAVFLNGLRQRRVNDFNETGNQSFSFLNAPLSGDILSVDYAHP
jgi:phage baseplate assembly protein W